MNIFYEQALNQVLVIFPSMTYLLMRNYVRLIHLGLEREK